MKTPKQILDALGITSKAQRNYNLDTAFIDLLEYLADQQEIVTCNCNVEGITCKAQGTLMKTDISGLHIYINELQSAIADRDKIIEQLKNDKTHGAFNCIDEKMQIGRLEIELEKEWERVEKLKKDYRVLEDIYKNEEYQNDQINIKANKAERVVDDLLQWARLLKNNMDNELDRGMGEQVIDKIKELRDTDISGKTFYNIWEERWQKLKDDIAKSAKYYEDHDDYSEYDNGYYRALVNVTIKMHELQGGNE